MTANTKHHNTLPLDQNEAADIEMIANTGTRPMRPRCRGEHVPVVLEVLLFAWVILATIFNLYLITICFSIIVIFMEHQENAAIKLAWGIMMLVAAVSLAVLCIQMWIKFCQEKCAAAVAYTAPSLVLTFWTSAICFTFSGGWFAMPPQSVTAIA